MRLVELPAHSIGGPPQVYHRWKVHGQYLRSLEPLRKEVYGGNAEAMHKFGFDGLKLVGCGTQTDMQLWDGVLKADGGPPVMVECR